MIEYETSLHLGIEFAIVNSRVDVYVQMGWMFLLVSTAYFAFPRHFSAPLPLGQTTSAFPPSSHDDKWTTLASAPLLLVISAGIGEMISMAVPPTGY